MREASAASASAPMPSATFSVTLSASNSEKCWNTIAMPSARASGGPWIVVGAPRHKRRPASACSSP